MSGTRSVCVVDDDPIIRMIVSDVLHRLGYESLEADNGKDALELILQHHPDAVLLDLSLPDMNGLDVCSSIHGMTGGQTIPVMIITGSNDQEHIHRAFDCGASDFITKPLNSELLKFRLLYMLRTHREYKDLCKHKKQLQTVKNIAEIADWSWDIPNQMLSWSAEMNQLLGLEFTQIESPWDILPHVYSDDRIKVSQALDAIFKYGEEYDIEYRIKDDYSPIYIHEKAQLIRDHKGYPMTIIGTLQNVTRRKISEEQLHYLAYHDGLTGLANREMFHNQLKLAIRNAEVLKQKFAVFFLDLDDFKQVNDSLGHDVGDELLVNLAHRLTHNLRKCDVISRNFKEKLQFDYSHNVARVGGDEFLILLMGEYKQARLSTIAERLVTSLNQDYVINGERINISVSLGIVIYPSDGNTSVQLFKNADMAMYRSKELGKNQYCFYNTEMNEATVKKYQLKNDLVTAVRKKQLCLYYQPIIDLSSEKVCRVEALVRWQHPQMGLLAPEKFIPLAEKNNHIGAISAWVLKKAARDVSKLNTNGHDLSWSVNVSVKEFNDLALVNNISYLLKRASLKASQLVVEITESLLMGTNPVVMKNMQTLRDMGIAIHIDDFGTGFSSLSYLSLYPFDVIKIDKSIVESIGANHENEKIIQAIITLSHSLNKKVVAEGVTNQEQLAILGKMGCDQAQGFYLSEPLELDDLMTFLSNQNNDDLPELA